MARLARGATVTGLDVGEVRDSPVKPCPGVCAKVPVQSDLLLMPLKWSSAMFGRKTVTPLERWSVVWHLHEDVVDFGEWAKIG